MTPDKYQAMALKTWYVVDNPLHLDPRHPLIKLAGEAGEILDLYGKHEYKPGFSWWNCKKCGEDKVNHYLNKGSTLAICLAISSTNSYYTPLILDELGDWWYYLRIVTYQQGVSVEEWVKDCAITQDADMPNCLAQINRLSARVLVGYLDDGKVGAFERGELLQAYEFFALLLQHLNCPLDSLTELNYRKLNSEPTAHGWKI